jgi:hypothetical protein
MEAYERAAGNRHEYQMKASQKAILIVVGAGSFVGMGLIGRIATLGTGYSPALVLTLLLAAFGLYALMLALRSRVVIGGSRIEVRGAFREQSADQSEIEGFRTISTRNGKFTRFYLKQDRGKITMSDSFNTDDVFRAWFRKIPDLDQRDREALLAEISQQQELGSTPEERLKALSQAKTWGIFAIIVAAAATAATIFGDPVLRIPFATVLALIPVALALLLHRSPLLYAVFKSKADPRAELSFALGVSSFGLFISIDGVHFISLQSLGLSAGLIAVAYCAAFFGSAYNSSSPFGAVMALLVLGGFYSYGLIVTADSLADNSKTSTYTVPISGKHTSSGRSTTYYLELPPWGPIERGNRISVNRKLYNQFSAGDTICLALHEGRLHTPWYAMVSCNAPRSDNAP